MRAFAVTFGPGPGWDPALPRREQREWDAHAAFMDGLVEDGFVLLGGPVGEGDRVLVAVEAVDEDSVRARFAADPWEPLGILRVERLEPWSLWLDARRRPTDRPSGTLCSACAAHAEHNLPMGP